VKEGEHRVDNSTFRVAPTHFAVMHNHVKQKFFFSWGWGANKICPEYLSFGRTWPILLANFTCKLLTN